MEGYILPSSNQVQLVQAENVFSARVLYATVIRISNSKK